MDTSPEIHTSGSLQQGSIPSISSADSVPLVPDDDATEEGNVNDVTISLSDTMTHRSTQSPPDESFQSVDSNDTSLLQGSDMPSEFWDWVMHAEQQPTVVTNTSATYQRVVLQILQPYSADWQPSAFLTRLLQHGISSYEILLRVFDPPDIDPTLRPPTITRRFGYLMTLEHQAPSFASLRLPDLWPQHRPHF